MAAEVKILLEGYTNADAVGAMGEEKTQPTITLVRDGNIVMVVDPGVLKNQKILIDALKKEGLAVEDVNVVCITHSHIDHVRNVGMFINAAILEFFGLWKDDTVHDWHEQFSKNIQVVRTPGHDYTGITLFVTTTAGVVAICGDIFWKKNYPEKPEDDFFASDLEKLIHSRKLVLERADWIIPGHAGMYRSDKKSLNVPVKTNLGKNGSTVAVTCKHCHRIMKPRDKCLCQSWLCFRCCKCGFDCPVCGCSHKG